MKQLMTGWTFYLFRTVLSLTFLVVFALLGSLDVTHAQKRKKSNHPVKYLSLSVGIYHDQKVPKAPRSVNQSGTFRGKIKLQYNPSKKILRFYPRKTGTATVILKNPSTGQIIYEFRIDIKKTNLYKVAREIRNLLGDIEGITIKIVNGKVLVDGETITPREMSRIHTVVKQYPGIADSLVTLSPIAQRKIARLIERDISNPEITVRSVNGKFILEGFANNKAEKDRAEIIAKTYVPDVVIDTAEADKKVLPRKVDMVINLIKIKPAPAQEPRKILQIVIHYVEIHKDYSTGFRIQWLPSIGDGSTLHFSTGGRSPGGVVATLTGTLSNLIPKLNWSTEHGRARILQVSTVTVQDGHTGIVNSISRLPYQVVNAEGQPSTNFEETGIRANINPQILGARSESVLLKINFSVKSLVSYTDAGPLTSSREIQTVISVRSGHSAAIGGLVNNDKGTNYNKLPQNSSRNPILSIHRSKDFRQNKSQFVVFVTPIIKRSASAGSERIKRKFQLRN